MRLIQLEYLLALKKYGSVSAAAEHLFVSQPTISVAIKDLERELDYPLIIRSNRGISFTEQGERVAEKARQVLAVVEEIRTDSSDDDQSLTGEVVLGCTPPYCKSIGLDVLRELRTNYPGIELRLVASHSADTIRMVLDGAFHMGLIQMNDIDQPTLRKNVERKHLRYGELFEDTMHVTVREGHPLAGRSSLCMSDLLDFPFVTTDSSVNRSLLDYYKSERGSGNVFFINDVCALRSFMYHEDAVAVIPGHSLIHGNQLFRDQVVPLEVAELVDHCQMGWITRSVTEPAVQKVLELLIAHGGRVESAR